MDNIIYLCSVPFLDNSYTNVLDFDSLESQSAYFDSLATKRVKGNVISDSEREQFTLNIPLQQLKKYDYLFVIDQGSAKRYYYFITNKSYKTSASSIVDIELDVFTTYLFDHQLLHSFVDRCHVPRWNGSIPTEEVVDEGLPIYDYVITNRETVADLKPSYVITSTEPLGIIGVNSSSGSDGNGTVGGGGDLSDMPDTRKVLNDAGVWFIPTLGQITATFPNYPASFGGGKHDGIDIANNVGTSIYAGKPGTVVSAVRVEQDGFGKYVKINHGSGVYSYYAHCNEILCDVGDVVNYGTLIARMGSTGNSTGPHLHWEIRVNGTPIHPDPNNKLPVGYVIPAD